VEEEKEAKLKGFYIHPELYLFPVKTLLPLSVGVPVGAAISSVAAVAPGMTPAPVWLVTTSLAGVASAKAEGGSPPIVSASAALRA
jgi:hypothetical protein